MDIWLGIRDEVWLEIMFEMGDKVGLEIRLEVKLVTWL